MITDNCVEFPNFHEFELIGGEGVSNGDGSSENAAAAPAPARACHGFLLDVLRAAALAAVAGAEAAADAADLTPALR